MSSRLRFIAVLMLAAGTGVPHAMAGPAVPHEVDFVGDAANRGSDPGALNFGRWGSSITGAKDKISLVQPREDKRKPLLTVPWTEQKIIDARKELDKWAASDPDLKAKLAKARASMPPSAYKRDLHPFEYLMYVKVLPDKDGQFIQPPPNVIKIVDQDEIARRLALPENKGKTAKDILDNFYKTRKHSVVTHTLTPIFERALVYYPG
jgi:hypothetical protein